MQLILVVLSADWGLCWLEVDRSGGKTAYLRYPPSEGISVNFKKVQKDGVNITVSVGSFKLRRSK